MKISCTQSTIIVQELQGRRSGAPVGLSNMALGLLGKPLNKAMQVKTPYRCVLASGSQVLQAVFYPGRAYC